MYSTGIAIAGSFLTSVAYVLVRKATKVNEHPLVVMFYFPLFTVPMCLPFLISNDFKMNMKYFITKKERQKCDSYKVCIDLVSN